MRRDPVRGTTRGDENLSHTGGVFGGRDACWGMRRLAEAVTGLLALTGLPYVVYLGLYWLLGPEGSPAEKDYDAEPTVSIVLPTYNEEKIVEAKLEDLTSLEYPMDKVEVVVVDSSTDGTREVIRNYFADCKTPELVLVEENNRTGVAHAVNNAMELVSSEVVFRTDCDSQLASDALREAVSNLSDADVQAVTGRQSEVLGKSEVEQDYRDITAQNQILESHLDSTFICHGPCFAFERSAFSNIEPDSLADDSEIGMKIRRSGGRVIMDPAVQFIESGASGFTERRTRKDRRAMGLVQLLVRNRDMLGNYGMYGQFVLPFNWWFMIISPWLTVLIGVLSTAVSLGLLGPLGLAFPATMAVFFWLGQRDQLRGVQPIYAIADSQMSLLIAQLRLVLSDGTGTWDIDRESRKVFE